MSGFCNTSVTVDSVRLEEGSNNGSNYVALNVPTLSSNIIYKIPGVDGSSGDVLQSDGSGGWSFNTVSGGSVTGATSIGVGSNIFKQVTSGDVEMRRINAGTNKTTLSNDSGDVLVSVNESNLDMNVLTTQGQILSYSGGNYTAINAGTAGNILKSNGPSSLPSWGGIGRLIDVSILKFNSASSNSTTRVKLSVGSSFDVESTGSPASWLGQTTTDAFNWTKSGYTTTDRTVVMQFQSNNCNSTVAGDGIGIYIFTNGNASTDINRSGYYFGSANTTEIRPYGVSAVVRSTTVSGIGVAISRIGGSGTVTCTGGSMIVYTYAHA